VIDTTLKGREKYYWVLKKARWRYGNDEYLGNEK
jgi:hypothetical protein